MKFHHIPVLFNECIDGLNIKENGVYVDGTAGGGGHSSAIAGKIKSGRLICIDRDPDAIKVLNQKFNEYSNVFILNGNHLDMSFLLESLSISSVDGILLDLGVSSHQLDTPERGFSYHEEALLDMRMSQTGTSAKDIVNNYDQIELESILFKYGEEKFTKRIVKSIIEHRNIEEIKTTSELASIISNAVPSFYKRDKNPCKKTFQALRIATNGELENLYLALTNAFELLAPSGRLAVISFHSLEDRIVKNFYKEKIEGCICPIELPICVCNHKPEARLVNRKPITASEQELAENNRSRSAKLRILEKL